MLAIVDDGSCVYPDDFYDKFKEQFVKSIEIVTNIDLNQQSNIDTMDITENNPDIPESPQTPEHNEPPPPPNSPTDYMEGGHKTKQKKLIYNPINQKRE